MRNVGYYDGQVGLIEEMRVPMNDRVCYFGDGVYDATYAKEGVPFLLEDHIDRFYGSAHALEIPFDMPKEALKSLILDLIGKVNGYLRAFAARRGAERSMAAAGR